MPYKLIIAKDLRELLEDALPGEVLDDLSDALNQRLAVSPTQWSTPARFPFVADHQVFEHETLFEGRPYSFQISFKYGQDEETLHIADIRWT